MCSSRRSRLSYQAGNGRTTTTPQNAQHYIDIHLYGQRRFGSPLQRLLPVEPDNVADDVTLEASAMDGAAQGVDAVRSIILVVNPLYPYQEIVYAGPYGRRRFHRGLYTTEIGGKPLSVAPATTPARPSTTW